MRYTIKVKDEQGNFYDNAKVENEYDAVKICRYYINELGYYVQLFKDNQDITDRIDFF